MAGQSIRSSNGITEVNTSFFPKEEYREVGRDRGTAGCRLCLHTREQRTLTASGILRFETQ